MNRILVTGGAGFVGSRVVRQLVDEGRSVALLLRETSNTRRLGALVERCTVIRGDVGQVATLREPLARFAPDAVLHLAWEGVKGADRDSAVQVGNVASSIDLYRLTETIGCKHFVGLGSQAEYGLLSGRIDESAVTRPTTAYGAAKLATGLVLERTAAAAGRPFAWLRLFSSYGPDDDPQWMIPYLIKTLLARQRPSLTKAEQVWDYLHVDDAASGIVAALDAGASGIFNLGSGQARPLRDIMVLLRDAIDPSLPLGFGEVAYRPDQVMHLESDIAALSTAAGWSPCVPLEEGLRATVDWHRRTA